jgi:serine/threonine protein kinase
LVRSAAAAAGFLNRQRWVWPLLALVALCGIGAWLRSTIERSMKAQIARELQTLLRADVTALHIWLRAQGSNALATARDVTVRRLVRELLETAGEREISTANLLRAPQQEQLRAALKPLLDAQGYVGFVAFDRSLRVIAAAQDELVGKTMPVGDPEAVDRVLRGQAGVTRPFAAASLLPDETGRLAAGRPTMFALAPVADDAEKLAAVLALRVRPDQEFSRILSVAQYGDSGETYAFDKSGLLLSQSRFDDDLKHLGLIPDLPDAHSVLALRLYDPDVDLTAGERPPRRRTEQSLTRMAADAVAGNSGVDVGGYRDYRGVPTLGAWTWLPEYGFGVATEVDRAEAYRPLAALRVAFWVLFGLLTASAAALFFFTVVVARLRRSQRRAELEAKVLGQYTLEEKIGAGGMGIVYRARHALLRRPTAIKLLNPNRTTDAAVARFEREVQLTSRLTHPNTIAIYDYGRTPDGIFYYAMEYLDGITLETLVDRHGPLPDGRVIYLLTQICGSLSEAHGTGLIHRDIKPANIMLTQRGGMADFAKLLDFGIVKALETKRGAALTAADALTGTPMYASPEAIETPDQVGARSDLYSLGAVAYYLLTGQPVFEGANILEVCRRQVEAPPIAPSQRLGRPIAPDLEALVLACLAKRPDDRPASAKALAAGLAGCAPVTPWGAADAEDWWASHPVPAESPPTTYSTLHFDRPRKVTFSTLDPTKLDFSAWDSN